MEFLVYILHLGETAYKVGFSSSQVRLEARKRKAQAYCLSEVTIYACFEYCCEYRARKAEGYLKGITARFRGFARNEMRSIPRGEMDYVLAEMLAETRRANERCECTNGTRV